ncbi:MAG: DUF3343 domain-containing protein [Tissierellia bacterium]|nr:DUF3343 domain-containing protein [Tissierellia bacterium]
MDSTRIDYYILFFNHTEGMSLYNYVKKKGIPVKISPAPRRATSCCGMSLLVDKDHIDAVRKCIDESGIVIDRIVPLENQINPDRDRYC